MSNYAFKMKKAYALLVVLVVLTMSAALINFIVEVKSLKKQNYTKELLYLQGKMHLEFLEKIAAKLDEETKSITLDESGFSLEVFQEEKTYELYVSFDEENIRLHKTLIK